MNEGGKEVPAGRGYLDLSEGWREGGKGTPFFLALATA